MNILFNELPLLSYEVETSKHKNNLDYGYASPIEFKNNATILCFQDVDDHIDGNGLSALWIIKGTGSFYYNGEKTELKTGDVVIFDDNNEHGFESNELCIGANFTINENYTLEDIKTMVKSINLPTKSLKHIKYQ